MLRIGLTGGIATGKSTVGALMAAAGAIVVDADAVAHTVTAPDGEAYAGVVAAFGSDILQPDGHIDRVRLGARVFSDEQARLQLNQLVHPAVLERLRAEEARYRAEAETAGKNYLLVLMIPLLYETQLEQVVDQIVVVYCPPDVQLERLMSRNGLSREAAQQRLDAQLPIDEKAARADYLIDNSLTPAITRQNVNEFLGECIWEPYEPLVSA
ncbi:MAG: dephospho-CoA kinase [Candidatus Sericytochromatia bacterium]